MSKDNECLKRALEALDLAKLPKKEDGENIWIRAVAKVRKRDGSVGYAYVAKEENVNGVRVLRDFGTPCAISTFEEFYPTIYLKASYLPTFKTDEKEERITFLLKADKTLVKEELEELDLKQLNKMIKENAMKRQIKVEKSK